MSRGDYTRSYYCTINATVGYANCNGAVTATPTPSIQPQPVGAPTPPPVPKPASTPIPPSLFRTEYVGQNSLTWYQTPEQMAQYAGFSIAYVAANDVTGIGIIDDPAIPIIAIGLVLYTVWYYAIVVPQSYEGSLAVYYPTYYARDAAQVKAKATAIPVPVPVPTPKKNDNKTWFCTVVCWWMGENLDYDWSEYLAAHNCPIRQAGIPTNDYNCIVSRYLTTCRPGMNFPYKAIVSGPGMNEQMACMAATAQISAQKITEFPWCSGFYCNQPCECREYVTY